jgi:hypothetical protein
VTGIVTVIFFGFLFLFLPETQYYRPAKAQAPSSQSISTSEDEITPPNQKDSTYVEDAQPVDSPVKKSFVQQLNPWSGINPGGNKANFLTLVVRSWPLVVYPAVIFGTINYGLGVATLLTYLDTAAPVFQSPPYNMSAFIQSLISVPLMIGGTFGCLYGGLGSDLFCKYRARKNNGVFEPENRLLMVIFPAVLVACGIIMSVSLPFFTLYRAIAFFALFRGADGGIGTVGVSQSCTRGNCRGSEQRWFHLVMAQYPQSQFPMVIAAN